MLLCSQKINNFLFNFYISVLNVIYFSFKFKSFTISSHLVCNTLVLTSFNLKYIHEYLQTHFDFHIILL